MIHINKLQIAIRGGDNMSAYEKEHKKYNFVTY